MIVRLLTPIAAAATLSLAACGQPAQEEASVPAEPAMQPDPKMDPEANGPVADVDPGEPLPPTTGTAPQVNPGPGNPPPTLPAEPTPPSTSPAPN